VNAEAEDNSVQALNLAEELDNIEADERLQSILAKQEKAIALTEEEVDYFNEMMERHQHLTEALAEDDELEEESNNVDANSEEDLWDKLDNSPLPGDVDKFE
jgi:ribosome assembly protein YihI (activator of Der GTPase)